MRFLLDTNLLSELTKDAPDARLKNWIRSQPQEELVVSALKLWRNPDRHAHDG